MKICLEPGTPKSREFSFSSFRFTRLLVEDLLEGSQRPRAARFDNGEPRPARVHSRAARSSSVHGPQFD